MQPKRPELTYRKRFSWLPELLGVDRELLARLIGTEWCVEKYPPGAEVTLLGGPPAPFLRRVPGGFDVMMSVDVTPISRGFVTVAVPDPQWVSEYTLDFRSQAIVFDVHIDDVPNFLPGLGRAVAVAAESVVHQAKATCDSCQRRYFGELLHPLTGLCYGCAFAELWGPISEQS